jgi:integrase
MAGVYRSVFKEEISDHMLSRKEELGTEAYRHYEHVISSFDDYLYRTGYDKKCISSDVIDAWIKEISEGIQINTTGQYIHYIRQMLYYLINCGYKCYIPRNLVNRDTYIPYIYSDEDIQRIFAVSDNLLVPHAVKNKWIEPEMPMLLRLLFCCGLRVGEATHIKVGDIDFEKNIIILKVTKKYKQRLVPFDKQLSSILWRYCIAMGIVTDAEAYIFPGTDREKPLAENTARNYFRRILEESGITRDGYLSNERGPCLHCFRHTFAIRSFKQAEMMGIKINDAVPFLSTYLGHDSLYETEKYLKFSGDMFSDSVEKFELFTDGIFPEVRIDG